MKYDPDEATYEPIRRDRGRKHPKNTNQGRRKRGRWDSKNHWKHKKHP